MKPLKALYNKEKNQFELDADYSLNCVSADLGCDEHLHEYVELALFGRYDIIKAEI